MQYLDRTFKKRKLKTIEQNQSVDAIDPSDESDRESKEVKPQNKSKVVTFW